MRPCAHGSTSMWQLAGSDQIWYNIEKNMKILHITETVAGASGVATFVRGLDAALKAKGVESRIASSVGELASEGGAGKVDIVHIHGLWLKPYHQAAEWAREKGARVVWSTHGMTAPWSMHHKWWKKLPAWWLYQRRDLRRAAAVHCTTAQEVEWNRKLGIGKCMVAPLGTEQLAVSSQRLAVSRGRVLLFVGRIHPVKGLENLIRGWGLAVSSWRLADSGQRLADSGQRLAVSGGWKLRIVGPDEGGYRAKMEALVASLGLGDSVEFAGAKFGAELSAEYENCDCLVLPSHTENFGGVVADALAHGKPAIVSRKAPWQELEEYKCGWWVENTPEALAKAIGEMAAMGQEERRQMGERGRKLAEEKYTWEAVAEKMIATYRETSK